VRIAFFNDAGVMGGGEHWVLGACRGLQLMGHEAMVICPWRSELYQRCLYMGVDVFAYLKMSGIPMYEPLFHMLRRRNIDAVYCTVIGSFCEAAVLGTLVDRLNRERRDRPAVLVLKAGLPPMRGMTPEHYGAGAGPALPRLHVVSEQTRQEFLRWTPQLSPDFVQVLLEGVDLSRFERRPDARAAARTRWGVADGDAVILNVSRLGPMKGLDNLLLAAPRVLQKHPNVRFLLAGDGEERARLIALRDRLQLDGRVEFLGPVDDVPSLLAASDILCHPAIAEGLPNAIVEALASGTPVVATDVGGIPEAVEHERTGLLVPAHDIPSIAASLGRLLDSPALCERLASGGCQVARERFDLQRNLEHLVQRLERERASVAAAYTRKARPRPRQSRTPIGVLFLMNALRIGGEETELTILSRYLDRTRFGLHVVSLYPFDDPIMVSRLRAYGVAIDVRCHAMADEEKVKYLRDFIRKRRIRVVVACQDPRVAYRVFQGLNRSECSLVEHGGVVEETAAIPKDRTSRYIGVSKRIRAAAARAMSDPADAVYLPSMVDTRAYGVLDRARLRAGYGFSSDACIVVHVGRLEPRKRVEDLLEAGRLLFPSHPQLRVLIVGGPDAYQPDYADRLKQRYDALPDPRITFAGPRGDVAEILSASDILVLPAVGEGMSHVINEAGAAGLAVIAADDGAAREQLADGAAGRLVPPGRPDLIAQHLMELAADAGARLALGARLRVRVGRRFAASKIVPRWETLLSDVAAPGLDSHQVMIASMDQPLDFPSEIQIQTITSCNAACVMCPYPEVSKEFALERMDERLFDRLLDECSREPGLKRIEPFLMNEAFTDNRIIDWIARAKQKAPHAMVTVTTNGSPLIPKVTDRLVRTGLDAIWFSFNGATPDTYEKIMGIPYARVKANIDYLLEVRPPTLQVFVNMIETKLMEPEIARNIRYWESRGVRAGVSALVNRAGNVRNYDDLRYTPQGMQPVRTCELPFYKMYILASGDAVLCCMDWRRQVVIGNVGRQSIRDIWNGDAYRRIRRLHIEGRDGEIGLCKSCSYTLS
jgi:glycosyltransferase involved in cell wall biosynthesis/MoaA/NifB/PqqE/SkfB family radical SAM enzyme